MLRSTQLKISDATVIIFPSSFEQLLKNIRLKKKAMKKYKVIETLNHLPDEFNVEELVEKLLFIEKIEKGIEDSEGDRTMSLQEAKEKMETKWQASK